MHKANECEMELEGKQNGVRATSPPDTSIWALTRPRGDDLDPNQWMFLVELADNNP